MRPQNVVLFALLYLSASSTVAEAASFRIGDIFVNVVSDRVNHYRPDGTLVRSFVPSRPFVEGATITRNGKLVTTFRADSSGKPAGLSIFDASGTETVIPTPKVSIPADVSVFSDGTFAINDQGDTRVHFYSPDGVFLRTISPALADVPGVEPFGSCIGPDDTLWVALLTDFRAPSAGGVARFTKSGELIGRFSTGFNVQEIAVDPVDNTLWIPSEAGRLHHFTAEGVELGSFPTAAITPFLRGVAVAADQSIYVTSYVQHMNSTPLLRYDRNGKLLGQFDIPAFTLFISVQTVPEPGALLLFCSIIGMCAWNRRFTLQCASTGRRKTHSMVSGNRRRWGL
jgi:hypothetical protein